MWEVEVTDQFLSWWRGLSTEQRAALEVHVELLATRGPSLGRPAVERIQSSRHHNMKELRASEGGALRALFMFDPRRQVILLLGGNKSGNGASGTAGLSRRLTGCTTNISAS